MTQTPTLSALPATDAPKTIVSFTPGVEIAQRPEELAAIHHPGAAAVLWQRQPLDRFQRWIDALPPEQLPSARIILRPGAVRDAVTRIADATGLPACNERSLLIDDIAALAEMFGQVMRAPFLRLRLDVVTTNACRKFHIDAVTARLVCTYRGTGTQYGVAKNGADPDPVLTVPTGAPFLLRGTKWPETPRSGLLHRSPPIEGSGETRLLLVLDPITDPEDEV